MSTDTSANSLDYFFSSRLKQFLFVASVALVITAALALRTDSLTATHPDFGNPWDHHKYIWMTENNPFGFHVAPFCWRPGIPLLAKATPAGTQTSYFIISFISVWMTGVALYYLARRFEFSKWLALAGMLMFFTLGWAVKANLYNIWKPDPLGFLIITLAIYTVLAGKDWLFAALLLAGVFVKESVLFVAPLYYTLNAGRPLDFRLIPRTLLLALPAVVAVIALRNFIPALNDDASYLGTLPESLRQVQLGSSTYNTSWLWNEIGLPRLKELSLASLFTYTIGTFGVVVWTLPLFSIRRNLPLLLRFSPFFIMVALQIFFATNAERLLVTAFPAVFIMALNGVVSIGRTLRTRPAYIIILSGALILYSALKPGMLYLPHRYEALLFLVYLAGSFFIGRWRPRGIAAE